MSEAAYPDDMRGSGATERAAHAVLVVDDDDFTRSTLAPALERHGFIVTAVATAREALALDELPPLALLDLDLGQGPTGIDLAVELRVRQPRIGLVLLTSYDDPRLLSGSLPAMPAGVRYLRKRDVTDIRLVVTTLAAARSAPLSPARGSRVELTSTMLDVLRMVAEGLSTQEIARRREVSPKAVEATITKLCEYFDLDRQPSHNQRVRLVAEYYALTGQVPR